MPIHDWTRVESGIFHHFHGYWIPEICRTLNTQCLPANYYALIDQVTGRATPDVLTLQQFSNPPAPPNGATGSSSSAPGGVAVASVPPKVRFHDQSTIDPYARKTKTVVIRHVSGDRIVAMIEIVSPGNKSSRLEFHAFVEKVVQVVRAGVHVLILDLFPPGPRDPQGIHAAIWAEFRERSFELPADKPLTFASYAAGPVPEAYVEPIAVGDSLPEMPLFLTPDIYIPVPLEPSYQAAWNEVPFRWREVLEQPSQS